MKSKSQLVLFPEIETALPVPTERPGIYAQVAEVTSAETADRLCELVAGLSVYIPARVSADHWLALELGPDEAQKVCDLIADGFGTNVDFPLGAQSQQAQTRRRVAELINQGALSNNEIAAATGTNRRTVSRIKRMMIDQAKRLT